MRAWWAQTLAEVRMTIRRGETLLLTIGIPVLLLVFFSLTKVTSTPTKSRIDFIAPGIFALCILSTSLVALSIATGFERSFGVLRRLHVTPLGTRRLIGAKIAGVLVTELLQVGVLSLVAFALSWRPRGGVGGAFEVVALLLLGSAGSAGIGLALAGRLRALWPQLNIVAVVPNGIAAVAAIAEHKPTFAFLDIRMPGLDGMQVAKAAPGTSHDSEYRCRSAVSGPGCGASSARFEAS